MKPKFSQSKPAPRNIWIFLIALFITCTFALPVKAQIYKYKKDGVWMYTDTPPPDLPADSEELPESGSSAAPAPMAGQALLTEYPARTPIEKATTGTVAIQTAVGFGSGFFISADGYVITNKHVIRSTEAQNAKSEDYFEQAESRIERIEKQLATEAQRLKNYQSRLDQLKNAAEAEPNPQRKQAYMEDYRENLANHRKWEADYEKRRHAFEEDKRRIRSDRMRLDHGKLVADLSQSFTIFLVDNTQLYVRLVGVSSTYDLALLKLDGHRVPCLIPGNSRGLTQGEALYAIGSPVKLQNSVTAGVFSGFEQGFIQTDTRIYPGNSGGPLVTADGRVVGINTFKQLTYKFEGLGFAIPIQAALQEFAAYITPP
jgi:serine protease Do